MQYARDRFWIVYWFAAVLNFSASVSVTAAVCTGHIFAVTVQFPERRILGIRVGNHCFPTVFINGVFMTWFVVPAFFEFRVASAGENVTFVGFLRDVTWIQRSGNFAGVCVRK